jgi:hypothetical protein
MNKNGHKNHLKALEVGMSGGASAVYKRIWLARMPGSKNRQQQEQGHKATKVL